MKPTKQDRRQDLWMSLLKPFVHIWMKWDMKVTYHYEDGFNRKRTDPYIMLANHTFLFDVVHVPLPLKKAPFVVASHNLFVKQPTKFLLTRIAHAIPKTKNASDLRTAKGLISAVKRGYPVLIFPEGNTTFTGETNYIESSTMKLIKKLNVDVVIAKVAGGYLSRPRFASGKRKNRQVSITYRIVLRKNEIKNMTLKDIEKVIVNALYHNDYQYQRKVMIPHPGKKLAEGLENILYTCPECKAINTINTQGNKIWCSHCQTNGHIDKYGFIQGFSLDNTVDWDHFQRAFDQKLKHVKLSSPCTVQLLHHKSQTYQTLGQGTVTLIDGIMRITGDVNLTFNTKDITMPSVTLRRDFNMVINGQHYLLKIEKGVISFLRAIDGKY